jgi:uncharacterized protein YidB (DUF937 family)
MSLLDTIAREAAGALAGNNAGTQSGLLDFVDSLLRGGGSGAGGLDTLVGMFRQNGLGELVDSWVGSGRNLPISSDQLQSVLGSQQVQELARGLGLDSSQVSGALADLLPQVIDKLTPHGQVPSQDAIAQGLDLLKGLGGR